MGIKGIIDNEDGEPIFNATIKIYQSVNGDWQYIDHDVTSSMSRREFFLKRNSILDLSIDPSGDYYRLLVDGSYAIQVKKAGYESQVKYIDVNNKEQQKNAQRVDFTLQSISSERADLKQMLRRFLDKVSRTTTTTI